MAIPRKAASAPEGWRLVDLITATLDEGQAAETRVIDLTGKSDLADAMVVATGRSSRHVQSLTERLRERLKAAGVRTHVEGAAQGDWVLVDAGDAIVHIFRPEVRAFYNLEKMWTADEPAAESRTAP